MAGKWGGARPGAGRRKQGAKDKTAKATPAAQASTPAQPKPANYSNEVISAIIEQSLATKKTRDRSPEMNPFQLPQFPKGAIPPKKAHQLAMDSNMTWGAAQWAEAAFNGIAGEGLLFLGYPYLSELAQRPEYRTITETIADDATRKWIDFEVTGSDEDKERARKDPKGEAERWADPDQRKKRLKAAGKMDKVKALKDDQERLAVRDSFYQLARNDGFFGRGHLFMDLGKGIDNTDPKELKTNIGDGRGKASKSKVGRDSFQALRVIEPVWCYPTTYNAQNPLRADWYNPQVWYVMGQEVHVSRIPMFCGHPVPDMLKPAYAFGGLSLSQMAKPYVDIWLTTRESVAELIHSFSVMVLMTDLQTIMQPGNAQGLLNRVALFNTLRDNQGTFVLNKDKEDFKNVSASLAGLHELQAQAQEHVASVVRIPLVKYTGMQPSGLNASAEGEITVYDDTIGAYQNRFFRPNLTRVHNFQQLSLFGEIDPEITFVFNPLRVMTEKEKAEMQKANAERDQIYVDMGAFSPEEIRKTAIEDPELPYAGFDPEDVPDLEQEEEGGLEPQGGRPDPKAGGEPGKEAGAQDGARPFGARDSWGACDVFEESKHPRADNGQFGSGGGGGGSKTTSAAAAAPAPSNSARGLFDKYAQKGATVADVMAKLPPEAKAAMAAVDKRLAVSIPTNASVMDGGHMREDGTYTPERQKVHAQIIASILTPEAIAKAMPAAGEKPVMTMLGGRGGSGKSWLSGEHGPVDASKSLLIDSDAIKAQLPGFEGWNAALYHEESSHILEQLGEMSRTNGLNVTYDATMKNGDQVAQRLAQHQAAGYDVHGYYMFVPPEEAAVRAAHRFYKGGKANGRYVPPAVVLANQTNEESFDKVKGSMAKWAIYSNMTKDGPQLVSQKESR